MMYNQKLVASIKANGKILREFKDTVYISFGSEYSILLKNLNTVRAIVNIYIDGDNVVPDGLVIGAGQEVDLERWVKNGNLSEGNRFKFIERTSGIEHHRGIKLEDGLIRVEYQFERVYYHSYYSGIAINNTFHNNMTPAIGSVLRSKGISASLNNISIYGDMSYSASQDTVSPQTLGTVTNDIGITVPGSKSEQKFSTCSSFPLESEKHSIVLKLLGETEDNKVVTKPVTVKHKPKCITCGKQNKATAKFCSSCGTALEIFA